MPSKGRPRKITVEMMYQVKKLREENMKWGDIGKRLGVPWGSLSAKYHTWVKYGHM